MSALQTEVPQAAITDLYDIMRDPCSGMRNRLNAAVAAARVERLAMPGEQPPEAVMFLREIIQAQHNGAKFRVEFRRLAATALSYYERRCKKAELLWAVPDHGERRLTWRRIINGALRIWLLEHGQWPEHKHVLLGPDEDFQMPADDPQTVTSAMLLPLPAAAHKRSRRARAIDERLPAGAWSGTEDQRQALLRSVAAAVAARLRDNGLTVEV